MFSRRTVRDDDRDVVYDDERRRPVDDREIVDDRAPARSERYVREDAPGGYAEGPDVVRAPRREYVEDEVVRPSDAEYVEEHGDTYLASLPARVNMVLFALLVALEALLGLRFALYAFGASNSSSFVRFIKDVSWPFVRPFSSAFSNRTWDQGIIEVNTLLAMGVWLLAFVLVMALVNAALPDTSGHYRYGRRHMSHM
jgi:hypothetical protein